MNTRKKDVMKLIQNAIEEFIIPIFLGCLIALVMNSIIGVDVVIGNSMLPTFVDGEKLIENKLVKFTSDLEKDDVITFNIEGSILIKRIIATPGDTVTYEDGVFLVNDMYVEEYSDYSFIDNPDERVDLSVSELTLGEDMYFVAGDNRNFSSDSRSFGPINISQVRGKIVFSFNKGFIQ